MDAVIAEEMTKNLLGKTLDGWKIERFIDHGKSAVVLEGVKDGLRGAVKVFDPGVVARFGKAAQLERIDRERTLIGKSHPNLVATYAGGEQDGYLYVVMEYFDGKNLAKALPEIPRENIRSLISQIASAAKFLEEQSFAHRDIKPENIGISNDLKNAKLLDLGVIRPIDLSSITDDGDQKFFIGTLQYSSPELLFREEDPSVEGWRAITFYQLGAVLFDLLTKRPLFEEFRNPYARLVRAVEREIPVIDSKDSDPGLRLLAQNCLAKPAAWRLATVSWEEFNRAEIVDPLEAARLAIKQRKVFSSQNNSFDIEPVNTERAQIFALKSSIMNAAVNTCGKEGLPRYTIRRNEIPHGFMLSLLFEPSERAGTSNWLALFIQGEVSDSSANMHDLRVWACVTSSEAASPSTPAYDAPCLRIKGVLIDNDIATAVERGMIMAFASPTNSNDQIESHWIELGEK